MLLNNFLKIIPSFGPVFHGNWQPGYIERNRWIYDFELVYFAKGITKVIFPDKVFLCPAGSTILVPPNLVHCSIALNDVERWCIHFDWFSDCRGPRGLEDVFVYTDTRIKFDPDLCASAPENLEFPLFAKETEHCFSLIRQYFSQPDQNGNRLIRQGLLLQILGLILMNFENGDSVRKNNRLILNAKNRIDEECLSQSFQVSDIAKEMQITSNHLSRIFRIQFGCSITEYIMRQRYIYARKELLETNLHIKEIAQDCGIPDVNYFCRFFRKMSGMSPMEWRKKNASFDEDQDRI